MKKNLVILIIFFFLLFIFMFSIFYENIFFAKKSQATFCFNLYQKHCFLVELAKTQKEKERGLMFRDYLDKDKGMLFIFEKEGIYPFHMKNTLIPLDIIWLDENKNIVFISENNRPCSHDYCPIINPETKAKYVLEINAGLINELEIKPGDNAKIDIWR
jgi:uncharacterized membrane protein (UPF0127 family)